MTNSNQPTRLALRNAVLIDGESVVAGKVVIVRGNRIEAVIPERDFSADPNVESIECISCAGVYRPAIEWLRWSFVQ
jgi:hypothetical protein